MIFNTAVADVQAWLCPCQQPLYLLRLPPPLPCPALPSPAPLGAEAPGEQRLVDELTNLEMLGPYWKRGHELRNTGSILCCMSKGLADRLMRCGNSRTNRGGWSWEGGGRRGGRPSMAWQPRIWSESRTPRRPTGQSRRRSALFDSGSLSRQRAARSGPAGAP